MKTPHMVGIAVVAVGTAGPAERAGDVADYAARLARVPGVTRVDSEVGIWCGSGGSVAGITCDAGDPCQSHSHSDSTARASPQASTSTRPSARLRA